LAGAVDRKSAQWKKEGWAGGDEYSPVVGSADKHVVSSESQLRRQVSFGSVLHGGFQCMSTLDVFNMRPMLQSAECVRRDPNRESGGNCAGA